MITAYLARLRSLAAQAAQERARQVEVPVGDLRRSLLPTTCQAGQHDLPPGARYCIQCGAPVVEAQIGPTQRLRGGVRSVSRAEYDALLQHPATQVVRVGEVFGTQPDFLIVHHLGERIVCEDDYA